MRRYDLNLLTALDALLRERSVSGAARRLGIGQPAMSAALARLRTLFGDPLLVRGTSGMEPTPRAIAAMQPLQDALAQLGSLIEPVPEFDPQSARRTFRLSGGDYVGMAILPPLMAGLAADAPGIDLRFRFVEKDDVPSRLDEGCIDLALLVTPGLPARFTVEPLFAETFVCAAGAGNTAIAELIDAARFASFDHLLVTERADERGRVDEVLALDGLARRVALTVPSAALVADILRVTNLVATVPRRAGERIAADGDIRLFEPPIEAGSWTMSMAWLTRAEREPGLEWLRSRVRKVVSGT